MGGGVGGVDELAGKEASRQRAGQLLRLFDGSSHPLGPLAQDQLRTVGVHKKAALLAHGVRHDDDDTVAPRGGDRSQADARVAGGGFDNDAAGLQQAFAFCVVDHGLGDPVLGASGGVEIFQLGQDAGFQVFVLLQMDQLQKRGPANQLVGGGVNAAHSQFLPF